MEQSSLLISDSLKGQLDLEDSAEFDLVKQKTCVVVVKIRIDGQNEALICKLRSVSCDKENKQIVVEVSTEQQNGLQFYAAYLLDKTTIHAIEIHNNNKQYDVLGESETPYECFKCNLYDMSIESDDCTLLFYVKDN